MNTHFLKLIVQAYVFIIIIIIIIITWLLLRTITL